MSGNLGISGSGSPDGIQNYLQLQQPKQAEHSNANLQPANSIEINESLQNTNPNILSEDVQNIKDSCVAFDLSSQKISSQSDDAQSVNIVNAKMISDNVNISADSQEEVSAHAKPPFKLIDKDNQLKLGEEDLQDVSFNQLAREIGTLSAKLQEIADTPENYSHEEKAALLKSTDKLTTALLNNNVDLGPLQPGQNTESRIEMAAKLRGITSQICLTNDLPSMNSFSNDTCNKAKVNLCGQTMNTGTYFQNMGGGNVKRNQVRLTRVNLDTSVKHKTFGKAVSGQFVQQSTREKVDTPSTRTRMEFRLNPGDKYELDQSLKAFDDWNTRNLLSSNLGIGEIAVVKDVKINYEKSVSGSDTDGPVNVVDGSEFGTFTSINVEGLGEVLIGQEKMIEGTGRYIPHYTVMVNLEHPKEPEADTEKQLSDMHKLLSLVGLSQVLSKTSQEDQEKDLLMTVAQTYLPSIATALLTSDEFLGANLEQQKEAIIDFVENSYSINMSGEQIRDIINREFASGINKETNTFGNEVVALSTVSEEMRNKGALGFFNGVVGGPGVVASVLQNGALSSHGKLSAGFKYGSTCQEDAVSGGRESIFFRLATKEGIKQMDNGDLQLSDCPYSNTFNLLYDLEVANLPNDRMNKNSFGLVNPNTELDKISGDLVFTGLDPISFTEEQSNKMTADNEIMVRTETIDSKYVKKVIYTDSREALLQFIENNGGENEPFIAELKEAVKKSGDLSPELKTKIENFLNDNSLIETKENYWGGEYQAIKGWNAKFCHSDQLDNLCVDLKLALKKEMQTAGLLDDQGKVKLNNMDFDEFVVKSGNLKESYFD